MNFGFEKHLVAQQPVRILIVEFVYSSFSNSDLTVNLINLAKRKNPQLL